MSVVDGVESDQGGEQAHVRFGDGVAHQVTLLAQSVGQLVETGEQTIVGGFVGVLTAGEAAPVHAVVDVFEDDVDDLVDLDAQMFGVEVRSPVPVVVDPLGGEVEGHLAELVGDHGAGGDVDDGRDSDSPRIVRVPRQVGVFQARDLQDRVETVGVEVEGPAVRVMGRATQAHRQHRLQTQQSAHDDRSVRPGACAGDDQPVPAGLDLECLARGSDAVTRDAGVDVSGVPHELFTGGHVGAGGVVR